MRCNLSRSKIVLFAVIVIGVMINSNFATYRHQTIAQSLDNSTSSISSLTSMMPNATFSPNNVTASIGDLILVSLTSSAGMRIPESNMPIMEVSWAGTGIFNGVTNVSDFGTVWVDFGTKGVSRSHGQGIIMDTRGNVVTYTVQAIGTMGKDGYLRNHGSVFFNASSEREFASLSKTVGVFADQVDEMGNAVTKIWELK